LKSALITTLVFCAIFLTGCASNQEYNFKPHTVAETASTIQPQRGTPSLSPVHDCKYRGRLLAGDVYISTDPFGRDADATVYKSAIEEGVDLNVYLIEGSVTTKSSRCGQWRITDNRLFADLILVLTENVYAADFSIFVVNHASLSGIKH
jgi:hypothetical protein